MKKMPELNYILLAVGVMAGVTYLIRALPLAVFRKKIKNRFLRSFLEYIPYAVLAAMTFPQILFSTGGLSSGIIGFLTALLLSYFEKSLLTVAAGASAAALLAGFVFSL